jgi:mono/diheme cytochrome c family protein
MMIRRVGQLLATLVVTCAGGYAAESVAPHAAQTFFADYCVKCHGPEKQKAERRLDQLPAVVATHDHLADVQDIIDQFNLG